VIYVTPHAVQRFQERVAPVSDEDAKAAILSHSPAIEKAAEFQCQVLKLGDGSRLALDGHKVVTVYARGMLPRQCRHSASDA
jgi:hypothetical protein